MESGCKDVPVGRRIGNIAPHNSRRDTTVQLERFCRENCLIIDRVIGFAQQLLREVVCRVFRCGITAARSSCPKLRMLSATMNRVPTSE